MSLNLRLPWQAVEELGKFQIVHCENERLSSFTIMQIHGKRRLALILSGPYISSTITIAPVFIPRSMTSVRRRLQAEAAKLVEQA